MWQSCTVTVDSCGQCGQLYSVTQVACVAPIISVDIMWPIHPKCRPPRWIKLDSFNIHQPWIHPEWNECYAPRAAVHIRRRWPHSKGWDAMCCGERLEFCDERLEVRDPSPSNAWPVSLGWRCSSTVQWQSLPHEDRYCTHCFPVVLIRHRLYHSGVMG